MKDLKIEVSEENLVDLIGAVNAQISAISNLGFVSPEPLLRKRRLNELRDSLVSSLMPKYARSDSGVNLAIDAAISL